MKKEKNVTFEELVEQAKALRQQAEKSEATFFVFLMRVEREHAPVWQEAGCVSFDQFLLSNDLCKPERYRLFRDGCDRSGLDEALANGAHWTMELGRLRSPEPEVLRAFSSRAEAFLQVHRTAPSAEVVRSWRHELSPRVGLPRVQVHASELQRLRQRVAELEAENTRLKATLAKVARAGKAA